MFRIYDLGFRIHGLACRVRSCRGTLKNNRYLEEATKLLIGCLREDDPKRRLLNNMGLVFVGT